MKKRLYKIIVSNSIAILGIKNAMLHERINERGN